jgi:hypothetical protein
MADKITAVRAEVLQWRLLGAVTWQAGATLLAGSTWNAVQLRTWTAGPAATVFSLRATVAVCALAVLQAAAVLVLRQVCLAYMLLSADLHLNSPFTN